VRSEVSTVEQMHVYILGYGGCSLTDVYQLGYVKKEVVYSFEKFRFPDTRLQGAISQKITP
jgi:hypothetical protein